MSNFTVQQKSQLAKLMATENLIVQHSNVRTASFNVKSRVLVLPVWKDMTGDVYDLLCGHEVGHAIYTPSQEFVKIVEDNIDKKNFKNFINVIEDNRIERKIQRKYPGLRASFRRGYHELMSRDLFGIEGRNVNSMSFIDRLNIYTKCQRENDTIQFSTVEWEYVNRVLETENWNEVVCLAEEIYEYSKQEQQTKTPKYDENYSYNSTNYGEYEEDDLIESPSNTEEDYEETEYETTDDDVTDVDSTIESFEDEQYNEDYDPICETDNNYQENQTSLLDDKCKDYIYAQIPTPILENIVTPAERVHEQISIFYKQWVKDRKIYGNQFDPNRIKEYLSDFKNKNERYVSLLAKEFEMRKAAKSYAKKKVSETGDLDINKLASYKFDDNIFRKIMMIPKGKSHGLILLLDYSGSMSDNMAGSIEQILVLTMFCRKVNIPFKVYAFNDLLITKLKDLNVINNKSNITSEMIDKYKDKCFTHNNGELILSDVYLREYLHSDMNNQQYLNAMKNMILMKEVYSRSGREYIERPLSESMSNTPLIGAIIACAKIMNSFKKKNNLDLTSLVIVHDGDSDPVYFQHNYVESGDNKKQDERTIINIKSKSVFLCDDKNRYQSKLEYDQTFSQFRYDTSLQIAPILNWFKFVTNSKVFGFFIVPNNTRTIRCSLEKYYRFSDGESVLTKSHKMPWNYTNSYVRGEVEKIASTFKSDKFLISNNKGYNSFFFIQGGQSLMTQEEKIEIKGKVTTNKLKNAFMKMNKEKVVNRILVSKFIQGMAA